MIPYRVSDRSNNKVLKLDWNESTQNVPQAVIDDLKQYLDIVTDFQLYPPVGNPELIKHLSKYTKVKEQNISVFNGSDSALETISKTFVENGDWVMILSPTYDNFRIYVEALGADIENVYYDNPFIIDIGKILQLSRNASLFETKLIYLVNPNNPTGVQYSLKDISRLCEGFKNSIIIVDEAYYEYSRKSAVSLLKKYPNLIITRTMSKAFGLAGFRVGYILTSEDILNQIHKVKNAKEVNTLANVAAISALKHIDYMKLHVLEVQSSAKWLKKELATLHIKAQFGYGNFFIVFTDNPKQLYEAFLVEGVLVRYFSGIKQLENVVRITL